MKELKVSLQHNGGDSLLIIMQPKLKSDEPLSMWQHIRVTVSSDSDSDSQAR